MDPQPPQFSLSRAPAEFHYALILTIIMSLGGMIFLASVPVSLFDKASAVVCFGLLLLSYLLFTSRHFVDWLRAHTTKGRIAFPAWLLTVYFLYALGPGRLHLPTFLLIPAYLVFPVLFASLAVKRSPAPNRYDFLCLFFLYMPIELAALARAWRPAEANIPSPSHAFSQLLGMNLALFCFLAIRRLDGIGFTFQLKKRDGAQAMIGFGWFFPLALAFAGITGFVHLHPHLPHPALVIPEILGITFMVALPEEVLFRGLLQNLLQRSASTTRGRVAALLFSSIVFGFSHLNNHPLFDWRYVAIASVAGVAYGIVYNRTGKVTASAMTHALVDIVHRLFF